MLVLRHLVKERQLVIEGFESLHAHTIHRCAIVEVSVEPKAGVESGFLPFDLLERHGQHPGLETLQRLDGHAEIADALGHKGVGRGGNDRIERLVPRQQTARQQLEL